MLGSKNKSNLIRQTLMKIKDLIKKLKEYNSEKDIVIYSCNSDLIEYGPLGFYENEGQVELHIDEGVKL